MKIMFMGHEDNVHENTPIAYTKNKKYKWRSDNDVRDLFFFYWDYGFWPSSLSKDMKRYYRREYLDDKSPVQKVAKLTKWRGEYAARQGTSAASEAGEDTPDRSANSIRSLADYRNSLIR